MGITMSKMTSKGQVTIPKRLREHLGLKPGSPGIQLISPRVN
jgi:bifunctional DNA-binding transcriptional regulator/antitoxin component of YhaV-PrlF toxin-antitoxin module